MGKVKDLLNYTIDNNLALEEKGKAPIAVSLEAPAGIGKTSVIEQVAKERGMQFVKLSLSQVEETGDIIGFPLKEYECQTACPVRQPDGTSKMQIAPGSVWLNEKQLDQPRKGVLYRQTGRTRMGYAKPAWVPEYNENGTLCLLDDYVRATPQILQACMELILTQKYISWSLPKKTTIILSNNPDSNEYNVSSLDEAQKTRFLNFEVAFDLDAWAEWAEKSGLDGRCINFVLNYSGELFNANADGDRICNPRSFCMFADMISGVKDWDDADNLNFISMLARGCFKDDKGKFAAMFASFIRNKMHLLIQPKEVLLGQWETVKDKLEKTLYDGDQYRPDIASIISRRFVNYVSMWLGSEEAHPIATVKNRILDFIDNPEKGGKTLFTKDLLYYIVKTITSSHKSQTGKLLFEPKIAAEIS